MKSILDPTFRYTPASHTDIRKTFDKARKELARGTPPVPPARAIVVPLRKDGK